MKRILIIGGPCSGKTTLARKLGKRLDLPVVQLDRMWWKRGRKAATREEFDEKLDRVLDQETWIMDGNFQRTMDRRIQKCDTIIYLDFGRWDCLTGLFQRLLHSPSGFDWSMVKSIWHFNENNRTVNYTYLAKASHAKTVILKTRKEVRAFLASL